MKLYIPIVIALLFITSNLATFAPRRSLHALCGQNLVCSDGLYCRRHTGAVYGSCEDPSHV